MRQNIKSNLTKRVTIRFSPEEYKKVYTLYKRTTKKRLSEFFRFVMLEKPVTIYTRNQSLDNFYTELSLLRNELTAIGNNLNQVVKKLNSLDTIPEVRIWHMYHENKRQDYMKKVNEIFSKINQITEQWSPE